MLSRFSWLTVFICFLIAAILEVMILPAVLQPYRPEWLAMVLIYWLLRHPEVVGMTCAVIFGLLMDVISGTAFGIHVLSFVITSYLILNMHHRLKMFPIIQQSIVVFILVATQLMMVSLLGKLLVGTTNDLSYLWVALTSAVFWPLVLISIDRLSFALR